jgi:hypothetical protein
MCVSWFKNLNGFDALIEAEMVSACEVAAKKRGGISVIFSRLLIALPGETTLSGYVSLLEGEVDSPNEIVIQMQRINILFDCPVSASSIICFDADTTFGFSRKHLASCVAKGFFDLFEEESIENIPKELRLYMVSQVEKDFFHLAIGFTA